MSGVSAQVFVELLAAEVGALADPVLYDAGLRLIPEERRRKVGRYRFEKDRLLSLGASLLMVEGLRRAGIPSERIELCEGAYGRPALRDGRVCFNLSHSGVWALCAVSDGAVGCDVEALGHADLRLAARFFHPAEYRDIAAQPTPEAVDARFYRYWTLKESYIKATGKGMSLPLNTFELRCEREIAVFEGGQRRPWHFRTFDDLPGYACALCAAAEPANTVPERLEPSALINEMLKYE